MAQGLLLEEPNLREFLFCFNEFLASSKLHLLRMTGVGGAISWQVLHKHDWQFSLQPASSASGPQLKLQKKQDIFHLTSSYVIFIFSPLSIVWTLWLEQTSFFSPFYACLEWSFLVGSDICTGALTPQLPWRWVWLHLENWQAGKMFIKQKSKPRHLAATWEPDSVTSHAGFLLHRPQPVSLRLTVCARGFNAFLGSIPRSQQITSLKK